MEFPFLVPENARMRAHISQRSNLKYVKKVLDTLDDRQLVDFRNSCLGFLADVPDIHFSAQLIQALVFHQIRTRKEHELWFNVQGHYTRFGMPEYALVTGLRCVLIPVGEQLTRALEKHRLKDRYFKTVDKISCAHLEKAMVRPSTPRPDRYKLGLVLLIEGIINAPDNNMGIDPETLSIVDDLELFFSYPWGRIGYRRLLKGFHNKWARKFVDARALDEKEVTYTLHGFPIAMQIWAYEAMPELGQRFAERVSERSPRLLCWSCAKQPQQRTYDAFFKRAQLHVHVTLRPTATEIAEPYMSTLVSYDDRPVPVLDELVMNSVVPQFNAEPQRGQSQQEVAIEGPAQQSSKDPSAHGTSGSEEGDGSSSEGETASSDSGDGNDNGSGSERSDDSSDSGEISKDGRGHISGNMPPSHEPGPSTGGRPRVDEGASITRAQIEEMLYDHRALTEMKQITMKLEIMKHVTDEFNKLKDFISTCLPPYGPSGSAEPAHVADAPSVSATGGCPNEDVPVEQSLPSPAHHEHRDPSVEMDRQGFGKGSAGEDIEVAEQVHEPIGDGAVTSPVEHRNDVEDIAAPSNPASDDGDGAVSGSTEPREDVEEIAAPSDVADGDAPNNELSIADGVAVKPRVVATTKRRRSARIRRPAATTRTPYTRGMGKRAKK